MRSFTPDVEELLEWFELTYAVESGPGWICWRRAALPYAGGLADQPHRLMQGLDYIARVRNDMLTQELERQSRHRRQRNQRG